MTSVREGLDKDCHVTAVPTICGYDHNQCCFNYIPFGALRVCLFHSYPLPFSFSTNQPATAQGSLLGELHYISLLVVPALETRRRVKITTVIIYAIIWQSKCLAVCMINTNIMLTLGIVGNR